MTVPTGFERTVTAWLRDDADRSFPDRLDALLERTVATRQRAWWSSPERWLPMDTTFTGRVAPAIRPAWPIIVLLLIVALAAAVVLVGSPRPPLPAPYGLADNGSIVYSADGAIRIADADGTDPRVLIEGPAEDVAPILSNDGTRLLFFRANGGDWDLWAARIDGSEVLSLTPAPLSDPRWADWSPDGSRVLVDHVRAGRRIMSVVGTDGSRSVRDLDVGLLSAERPMWRPPDGREVVFRGEQDGRAALYSIGADGVGLRQIAPKDAVDDGAYLEPRVAPDGTRMTYWHNRPVDPTPFGETRKSEVHVLDIATGEDVRVGYDPTSRHEFWPKFSPDGRSILMARLEGRDAASVVVALSDGSDGPGRRIARYSGWLATGALSDPVLEFSPDGRKIALSFGAAFRVKIIDVATGTEEFGDNADWVLWQRIAAVGAAATGPGPTPCPGICSR